MSSPARQGETGADPVGLWSGFQLARFWAPRASHKHSHTRRERLAAWRFTQPAYALALVVLIAACGNSPPKVTSNGTPSPSSPSPSSSPLFTVNPNQFGHLPAATPGTLKGPLPITCTGDIGSSDPV